jgi:cytochrome oxidase Cu insertion factor (SCO1/SenC/PrrC family)
MIEELRAEYEAAREAKNAAYWRFTRCANGCPVEVARLATIEAEKRRAWLAAKYGRSA